MPGSSAIVCCVCVCLPHRAPLLTVLLVKFSPGASAADPRAGARPALESLVPLRALSKRRAAGDLNRVLASEEACAGERFHPLRSSVSSPLSSFFSSHLVCSLVCVSSDGQVTLIASQGLFTKCFAMTVGGGTCTDACRDAVAEAEVFCPPLLHVSTRHE